MKFTKKDLNKTLWVKPDELVKDRKWYKINADGKTLWRMAVVIARILLGKNKAHYSDFRDAGDFVIVENVEKMKFTGNKLLSKPYYSYSWFKWNLKTILLGDLMKKNPAKVLELAVRWMLARNKLRDKRMMRLKVTKWPSTKYDNFKPINIK